MPTSIKNLKISKKSILIFGITGQDRSLLAKEYLNKNFKVFGVITSKIFSPINLDKLNIHKKVKLFNKFTNYKTGIINSYEWYKKHKVYKF